MNIKNEEKRNGHSYKTENFWKKQQGLQEIIKKNKKTNIYELHEKKNYERK